MRKFELEAINMLAPSSSYPGAFGLNVEWVIRRLIKGTILHLFSGASNIGDERIDIENPAATIRCEVGDFVVNDERDWDWVILDPPYAIKSAEVKLVGYGNKMALSASVPLRRKVKNYLQKHADNVLWLDLCAPTVRGFYRKKLWLVLPGGFHHVRVLSWLKREMKPLL